MKKILFAMTFFIIKAFFTTAYSAPAQIVIIRHGEKPQVGNELSMQGWQRANALPLFFTTNKIVNQFGKPIALYAGAPNKPGGSIRSIQTITPYANQSGLMIHKAITKDEIHALVNEVLTTKEYAGHTVIICWEHSVIPEMAHLFGATDAPTYWEDSVFDRAWVIGFTNSKLSNFIDLPQHLLPGDSAD